MSWENAEAKFVNSSGRVARRQEAEYRLAHTFREEFKIVKTVMKGANLFGAVEDTTSGKIFGCVLTLTTENGSVWWRTECEDVGPVVGGCPESILKLLTPTDNECAINWRKNV